MRIAMVKRHPPLDRDKVKIASFRITEGEWFDFSQACEKEDLTATDILKGAIRNFLGGTFVMPPIIDPLPQPTADSDQWQELRAEIDQLRQCLRSCATQDYVVAQLEPLRASITSLSEQQALLAKPLRRRIGTPSAKAKKTGSPKA
jgi:hypothetical protein